MKMQAPTVLQSMNKIAYGSYEDIIAAVTLGETVYWQNKSSVVLKNRQENYFVQVQLVPEKVISASLKKIIKKYGLGGFYSHDFREILTYPYCTMEYQ
jgi:hypothetical protein